MDNTQLNIETNIDNKMITVNLNENRCSICLQEIQSLISTISISTIYYNNYNFLF